MQDITTAASDGGVAVFNQILTTLDGSEYAERAVQYTRGLAKIADADVRLLTVITTHDPSVAEEAARAQNAARTALAYLDEQAEVLRSDGVHVTTEVRYGEPAPLITEAARELQSDLIVMSTQGLGADGEYALGSVALSVLMSAPCPVFLVRINRPEPPRTLAEERWQAEGGANVG